MPHRKAYRWLNSHPVVTTVAVVSIVAVPGYLKLQAQADENTHQGQCNTQAWSLLAAVITADNGPWVATHKVLSQKATEGDYSLLRKAVNARFRVTDDFAAAIKTAAAECGNPVPLPPALRVPKPTDLPTGGAP